MTAENPTGLPEQPTPEDALTLGLRVRRLAEAGIIRTWTLARKQGLETGDAIIFADDWSTVLKDFSTITPPLLYGVTPEQKQTHHVIAYIDQPNVCELLLHKSENSVEIIKRSRPWILDDRLVVDFSGNVVGDPTVFLKIKQSGAEIESEGDFLPSLGIPRQPDVLTVTPKYLQLGWRILNSSQWVFIQYVTHPRVPQGTLPEATTIGDAAHRIVVFADASETDLFMGMPISPQFISILPEGGTTSYSYMEQPYSLTYTVKNGMLRIEVRDSYDRTETVEVPGTLDPAGIVTRMEQTILDTIKLLEQNVGDMAQAADRVYQMGLAEHAAYTDALIQGYLTTPEDFQRRIDQYLETDLGRTLQDIDRGMAQLKKREQRIVRSYIAALATARPNVAKMIKISIRALVTDPNLNIPKDLLNKINAIFPENPTTTLF